MNLTSFKLRLRKYGALIATLAVVVVAGISLATIWFLQQNQGPVAPTAPESQPQASGNVCSVEWVVRNGCQDLKVFNADSGAEIPATQPIAKGTKLQWSCAGLPGTNFFRYRYRPAAGAEFVTHYEANVSDMADPNNPRSTTLDTANLEYLELFCRPFAGDFGATMATVRNNCQRVIAFESAPLAQCSQACSADSDCSAGLTCSGGMCRNPACTGEVSCTCPTATPTPSATPTPTPIACEAAAFTEAFADTTLDVKVRKVGSGELAVANGRATMSVTSEASQFVAVEGREFVQGNFQTSIDLSEFTAATGTGTVETALVTATSTWEKQYRVTWQKGANNSTSRLLVQSVVPGTTAAPAAQFTTLNTTEIAANAAVTLRAVREGGTLRFYSQQSGQAAVLLASVSTTEALRPVVLVTPNATGRAMSVVVDNFTLVCDTTIPTPPPGPVSCNNTCTTSSQCGSGLTCSGGVCRNPSCTNESSCTCPTATATPVPVSCNNTCSANSDCGSGLTCSGGVCRNPSCTNQSNCTCPTATATPTATPRPTTTTVVQATPTPTPPASCGNTCVTSSDCRNGLTCSNGQCRNPSCNDKTNCVCDVAPVAQATPTPAPELPQAGSVGQTVAILMAGAAVVAIGLGRWYYFKR